MHCKSIKLLYYKTIEVGYLPPIVRKSTLSQVETHMNETQ